MTSSSTTRLLPQNYVPTDPFKTSRAPSPLRSLPSCSGPEWIKPDPAHTYAIHGWGKDYVSSAIILLMYFGVFGFARNIQKKLDVAFQRLKEWCHNHCKTTSLTTLSLKVFKVSS